MGSLLLDSNNRVTIKVRMDIIDTILMVFTNRNNPAVVLNGDKLLSLCVLLKMFFLTGGSGYTSTQVLLSEHSSIKGGENEVGPCLHLPVHKEAITAFRGRLLIVAGAAALLCDQLRSS